MRCVKKVEVYKKLSAKRAMKKVSRTRAGIHTVNVDKNHSVRHLATGDSLSIFLASHWSQDFKHIETLVTFLLAFLAICISTGDWQLVTRL